MWTTVVTDHCVQENTRSELLSKLGKTREAQAVNADENYTTSSKV